MRNAARALVGGVADEEPVVSDPVFHQQYNGPFLENMMSISAMSGFQHMSHEELRVADWNLDRRISIANEVDLGIHGLKALSLGRAWEKEDPLPIPGSNATAGPSNRSGGPAPPAPSGVAGTSNGTIPSKPRDAKPTFTHSRNPDLGNSASRSPITVPTASNALVAPMLRAEADQAKQVNHTAVPPVPIPAPTVNSALQADTSKAPNGVGRWGRADKPPATFLLSPAAERSRTVGNAETEWADALQRAREAKAQLARAQAAYDQAVAMEKLKFKAYSEARERFDE